MKRSFFLVATIFPILFSPLFGCETPPSQSPPPPLNQTGFSLENSDENEHVTNTINMPQTDIVVHLPFAPWIKAKCPQWMYATDGSENGVQNDVVFQTKSEVTELFAPVSGILFVHADPKSPFGKHVTIDHSDGTYTVLGGFTSISAKDAHQVSMGQLIGYTSCDPDTATDVYLGVHAGDATQPAQNGISIPAQYRAYTADPYTGTLYDDAWLVCSQVSDESDAQIFDSGQSIVMKHPDGTLVKTPDINKIYLLANGKRKEIVNQQILESYGYFLDDVVTISNAEMDCVPEDQPIDKPGYVEAMMDPEDNIWLVVGNKTDWNRYRIRVQETAWEGVVDSWGLPFYVEWNPPPYAEETDCQFTDWPIKKGFARFRRGTLVKETSSPKLYVITNDVAMEIQDLETFLLLGYSPNNIVVIEDGALKTIQKTVGDCEVGNHCLLQSSLTSCGL